MASTTGRRSKAASIPSLKYKEPSWSSLPTGEFRKGLGLQIIQDDELHETYPLFELPYIMLGKLNTLKHCVDVVIDDGSVSRQHAVIQCNSKGDLFLFPLETPNGTWINMVPVEPHRYYPLRMGDLIGLGNATKFVLITGPESTASPGEVSVLKDIHSITSMLDEVTTPVFPEGMDTPANDGKYEGLKTRLFELHNRVFSLATPSDLEQYGGIELLDQCLKLERSAFYAKLRLDVTERFLEKRDARTKPELNRLKILQSESRETNYKRNKEVGKMDACLSKIAAAKAQLLEKSEDKQSTAISQLVSKSRAYRQTESEDESFDQTLRKSRLGSQYEQFRIVASDNLESLHDKLTNLTESIESLDEHIRSLGVDASGVGAGTAGMNMMRQLEALKEMEEMLTKAIDLAKHQQASPKD